MEEFADLNAILNLTKTPEEISPVERLLNEFETHEAREADSIDYYKKTLSRMPNSVTRFLMQLIVSDEEKHRAVIHAMVCDIAGKPDVDKDPRTVWKERVTSQRCVENSAGLRTNSFVLKKWVLKITNSSAKRAAATIMDCSRFFWTR